MFDFCTDPCVLTNILSFHTRNKCIRDYSELLVISVLRCVREVMTEARFLTVSPGFHPFTPSGSLFCETGNVLDLSLPVGGVFTASAQKFGDFLAGNPNAELFKQQLQLYGHLVHAAGDYAHNKYVKVGGHSFPRIVSAVLRISKTDGSLCGYMFRTVWLEAESEIEDSNLDAHRDGPEKAKTIAIRRSQRNLNYGLAHLFTPVCCPCVCCSLIVVVVAGTSDRT
jgi:hypothetical protein